MESSDALEALTRVCTTARRSVVRAMVKAIKTPKRKVAMLASATSTSRSPRDGPTQYDATATMMPAINAGQSAVSPCRTAKVARWSFAGICVR